MSDYQYYEFQAIDRPLTAEQVATLRARSTRARITSTRFVNAYDRATLRAEPDAWMRDCFDAFVFCSGWGARELKLRLPAALLPIELAGPYLASAALSVLEGPDTIVTFASADEGDPDTDGAGWLGSLLGVREALARGDTRALYLGWLAGVQMGEVEPEVLEPPVPPGLGALTGALTSLAEFLRLSPDLLAVAAEASAPVSEPAESLDAMARWIARLPAVDKDALLVRLMTEGDVLLRAELLARFERARTPAPGVVGPGAPALARTADALRAAADAREKARRARALAEAEAAR